MNNLSIRPALPKDAGFAMPLIIEAIGAIACRLTGMQKEEDVVRTLLTLFKQETNRHSYLYTWIAEQKGVPAGILVLYDGQKGEELDAILSSWLQKNGAPISFLDKEAHSDEWYIDTICVHPDFRGQGIGTILLDHAEKTAKQHGAQKLALNVEIEKKRAHLLYKRKGFEVTEPWTIIGEPFHHMVKHI
ncbi:GNAT family N-acetyltransferase [Domibacillus tundrae]|uniref:GNAT family N-acetyltransferase n=1 Tax=Domibacillus tundrae TaxID=1587527 RepID=UPI003395DD17